MVVYGFGTSQTVLGMTLDLLLVHKVTRAILETKVPKAIRVSQVMMVRQAQTVPKAILVKLVHLVIRDYQVKLANEAIRANQENLGNKVSKEFQANRASRVFPERKVIKDCLESRVNKVSKVFQVSKVNKEFLAFLEKVFPPAGPLVKYWPNYLVMTMTQVGLINLVILTD
jgi:hypothetical protein